MKLLVAGDAHIYQTPDGKHWCPSIYGYAFWSRYLDIFEEVRIVARMKQVKGLQGKMLKVDGHGVEVFGIPFYQGPKQLMKNYIKIQNQLKGAATGCSAALLRVPGQTAQMTYSHLPKSMPVALEVVFDPSDTTRKREIMGKIINYVLIAQLKKDCANANGVAYVTKEAIQKHFPSYVRLYGEKAGYFETYYSSVALGNDAFTGPRDYLGKKEFTLIMTDAAMNSGRKGELVFIECIRRLKEQGANVKGVIIGDGSMRVIYQEKVDSFGLHDIIRFTGRLATPDEVRNELIKADIFLFPTQAEGLPRGILEAMATGLPIVSTPVGGIPEVIEGDYLCLPNDVTKFCRIISGLIANTNVLNALSIKNYSIAQEYRNDILQPKRNEFYSKLRDLVNVDKY